MNNNVTSIRLQKFLADRGIASRRQSAQYISDGRVKVNGKLTTEPGMRIDPAKDKIVFDDQPVSQTRESFRTIMLYKPRGYLCSTSSAQGKTVYELISGIKERLVPVGRLDKNSEGLLIMSNDGHLVLHLTHPRFEQEKTYHATVSGEMNDQTLAILRSAMVIEGYKIRPATVKLLRESEKPGRFMLEFVLKEGRKRQIRHMCENANLTIHRLVRVKIKNLSLGGVKPGKWRDLTAEELRSLSSR